MANEIQFDVVARLDKIDDQLKSLTKKSEDAGKQISKNLGDNVGSKITESFKVLAGAAAAAAGAIASAFAVGKSVNAAIEQENAVNRLNQSLASAGTFSKQASEQLQEYANQLQRTTTIEDDAALSALALSRNFTQTNDQARRLTEAAVDLSAAMGISLESAVEQLGKTFSGNAGRLATQIPALKGLTEEALRSGEALNIISERFGGSAAAQINTFGGALKQLQNIFGDVLEEIGNFIIKSPVIQSLFKFISQELIAVGESLSAFRIAGGDALGGIITQMLQFYTAINTYLIAPFEVLYNVSELVLNAIRTGLQTLIVTVTQAVSGYLQVVGLFTDQFKTAEENVKVFADSSKAALVDMTVQTGQSFKDVFETSFTESTQAFLDRAVLVAENAKAIENEVKNNTIANNKSMVDSYAITFAMIAANFDQFKNNSVERLRQVQNEAKTLSDQLRGGFINGVASAFSAFGAALANGENGFAAFGKSILRTLGQLAIQVGSFFIAVGAGLTATTVLFGFSGGAAIAAGIALTILGGALQALGGGGGGGATAGAPAAGSDTGGGVTTGVNAPINGTETALADAERQSPSQNVEVNIAGSVLGDKRTLGREIADAINESFGFDGAIVRTGAIV